MRAARAERNFLDKERLALAERGQDLAEFQAQSQLQNQRASAAQGQANTALRGQENQISMMRAQIEMKRLQQADGERAVKALSDFELEGSAFVPWHAPGLISKMRKPGVEIDETPIPGLGTLVRRVTGPAAESVAKARAEREKIESQTALFKKRLDSEDALQEQRRIRAKQLASGMTANPQRLASLLNARKALNSIATDSADRLEKQAFKLAMIGRANEAEALLLKANDLNNNKQSALTGKLAKASENLDIMIAAATDAATRTGPGVTSDSESVMKSFANGAFNALSLLAKAISDPAIDIDEASAHKTLEANFKTRPAGRGPEREFYADLDTGKLVPLNKEAYQDALKLPKVRRQLHPRWKQLGWKPGGAKTPAAPPPGPSPIAPTPPAPLSDDEYTQAAQRLSIRMSEARAAGDTAAQAQLQREAQALKARRPQ
jgi:hypothetical protein